MALVKQAQGTCTKKLHRWPDNDTDLQHVKSNLIGLVGRHYKFSTFDIKHVVGLAEKEQHLIFNLVSLVG